SVQRVRGCQQRPVPHLCGRTGNECRCRTGLLPDFSHVSCNIHPFTFMVSARFQEIVPNFTFLVSSTHPKRILYRATITEPPTRTSIMAQAADKFLLNRLSRTSFAGFLLIATLMALLGEPLNAACAAAVAGLI